MLLPDVNVLIYSHRTDSCEDHGAYAAWLTGLATGYEPFALSSLTLAGLVRIVTNNASNLTFSRFTTLITYRVQHR